MIYNKNQFDSAILFIKKQFERNKSIKIEAVCEAKTLSQVRYTWLIFTILAQETGNNKEDIYQYFLTRFPTYSEIELFGAKQLIPISMSKFTDKQMSHFIDKIVTDARQEGYIIPEPDNKDALAAYNYYHEKGII
jgi:serine/threonine protein kinase